MRTARVRPVIAWCLAVVLLASAWAWLVPVKPIKTVQASARLAGLGSQASGATVATVGQSRGPESFRPPERAAQPMGHPEFEPALRDPFASPPARTEGLPRAVVMPPLGQTVAAAPMPMIQPPLVQPSVPRYLGQLRTPQGELLVLLDDGGATSTAQAGTRLPSGWEVAALEPGRVRLVMAATAASATVEIPSASEPSR